MRRRDFMSSILASGAIGASTFPVLARYRTPQASPEIFTNQAGYFIRGSKVIVTKGLDGIAIALRSADAGTVNLDIKLSPPIYDEQTGLNLRYADLTGFSEPGTYRLHAGEVVSDPFVISDAPYSSALRKLLRSYYLQRCGVALDDAESGLRHAACHLRDASVFRRDEVNDTGHEVFATGGWHDAGDFGKYIATTAVTVGRVLALYEDAPDLFSDGQLDIPESGSGRPDILDEMLVGLRWMARMQRSDGAVYRKLSGDTWPTAIRPEEDDQKRYLFGVSSPETAKFAAAMAIASRVYAAYLPADSANFRDAAVRAWRFLETVRGPQFIDAKPEDDSGSGPYIASQFDREPSLISDRDDRLWAAAELYRTTREKEYLSFVQSGFQDTYGLFEWKDPSALGLSGLLFDHDPLRVLGPLKRRIGRALVRRADRLTQQISASGFGNANDNIIWGSNKMTAEEGIALFHAYRFTGNRSYLSGAERQCDYLLGSNPFAISFVTGVGTRRVEHVAHLYARAVEMDIPGLLVGGPNNLAQAGIAPENLGLLSYVDDARSYATNEPAIDYNASMIGLVGYLSGLRETLR